MNSKEENCAKNHQSNCENRLLAVERINNKKKENNDNRSSSPSSPSFSSSSSSSFQIAEKSPVENVVGMNKILTTTTTTTKDEFKVINNNIENHDDDDDDEDNNRESSTSKICRNLSISTNGSSQLNQSSNNCGSNIASSIDLKKTTIPNPNPTTTTTTTTAGSSYSVLYSKNSTNYTNTESKIQICNNSSSESGENGSKEDTDMINNVDYESGVEKCPAKVNSQDINNSSSWIKNNTSSSPSSSAISANLASTSSFFHSNNHTINNIGNSIGSTSQGTCCFLRPNINGNKDSSATTAPGTSGIQRSSVQRGGGGGGERQDSSSGNEGDMSDGEDCCFYTYKGLDDPSRPEFRRELGPPDPQREDREAEPHHSGSSSPEMDFLEMDFDPGPSCEQDTGDSDMASINEDIQNIAMDTAEPDPPIPLNDLSGGRVPSRVENLPSVKAEVLQPPCPKQESSFNQISSQPSSSHWVPSTSGGIHKWEATGLHRATLCPLQESYGHHNTNGDLISPGDSSDSESELWIQDSNTTGGVNIPESSNIDSRKVNLSSTLYHRMMAKKLMLNKQTAFNQSGDSNLESELCANQRAQDLLPIEKIMLWSEQEATVKQVTQIATSACGATAAINALLALDVAFSSEVLVRGVATRLREPGTALPRYLLSRSNAGATHKDLARGMSLATSGAVVTKFFDFYPERKISFSHWLHYWISKGAVPIATLNLQHCGEGTNIPDAWHHQMIFGVGPSGIYLSNPLQCLPEQVLWHQLVSPSILLIRRQDVLSHWSTNTDLRPLALLDNRWRRLNVLGQVVNLVRETMGQRRQSSGITSSVTHIRIPASYRAGITLVMKSDASSVGELLRTEQLPLL